MAPLKVLYLIETLGVGGAEQSLLQILPRLRTTEPVMCHVYEGDDLKQAYENAGIRVVSLGVLPKYRFATAIRRVETLVRAERPSLIHTTLFRAEMVGRAVGRRLGIPVVSSFVSECYADIRWRSLTPAGRIKLKGIYWLDRLTAPWACHFIANSEAVGAAESQALGVPRSKVTVIHRGRDPRPFEAEWSELQMRSLRHELRIGSSATVLLNVSRLLDSKGQKELIEAFARVLVPLPDVVLLIAGEGPERDNLERQIRSTNLEDKVRLLGRRDDIPRLLALASVFAFPSHFEGHPGALVEAMLAAKPIVASDIPVHRETITHGETGMMVPPRREDLLAQAITSLIRAPRVAAEMGHRAKAAAIARFHVERAARKYDELYEQVVRDYSGAHG